MIRREFTRNQKEQIVERSKRDGMRSKSKCSKWIFDLFTAEKTNACIEWPFSSRPTGYGQIFYAGRRTTSNRLICEMYRGPAPSGGYHAAHECGNRSCCNPEHITWKTVKENQADKEAHGTQPHGSKVYNAKLTESAVVDIREASGVSCRVLAAAYGVSIQTISDVKNRKIWRHV